MGFALRHMKIAHRLALAASSFAVPVIFLLYALVSEQDIGVDFLRKEVSGASYLADLAPIQARAAEACLLGEEAGTLAPLLETAQARWGGEMHSAVMAALAAAELRKPRNIENARIRLRTLIARVGDKSNLILDNVLDTYYLADVVLNRLPDVIDQLADVTKAAAPGRQGCCTDGRVQQLMGLGMLVSDVDGLDASLRSAEASAGGEMIMASLDKESFALSGALRRFVAAQKSGSGTPADAAMLARQTGQLAGHAAGELHDLLVLRLTDLQAQRMRSLAFTAMLFSVSIALVLYVVVQGVTQPLLRMHRATLRLAAGDLETEVPAGSARNEVGDMNRALRQFRTQLLHARALEAAREQEAERVLRAKSDFLATMSHEIRSPMSGLIGVLELLRGTRLEPEQARMADMVHNSASMLLAVLNDVLDFSKIEAGAMTVESEKLDLRRLLGDVVEPNAISAARKGLPVKLHVAEDVPACIRTDPLRLRQILGNLLSNAIKFTSYGEVCLNVTRVEEAGGIMLRCVVRDTGIGIAPDIVSRLFNPFVQADGSTTRQYGGTGLGLSISANLARLLGGSLAAESEPGRGSAFTVSLPLLEADFEHASAASGGAAARASFRGRLLVVDDDRTIRWLLQRQLEMLGFGVDSVENGESALQKLLSGERYDALMTDCHMPVMDGVALTRAVRALDDPALKNLPIIGLTADVTEAQRTRCLQAGMTDLSIKPVSLERLTQIANFHLSQVAMGAAAETESAPATANSQRQATEGEPCFDPDIYLSVFAPGEAEGAAWLTSFVHEAQRDTAELRSLIAREGTDASAMVAKVAHHLAGAAFSVGATKLGTSARALEHAALDSGTPFTQRASLFEAVCQDQALAEAAIAAFLGDLSAQQTNRLPTGNVLA